MDATENLLFTELPETKIANNIIMSPIPIRYHDEAMLELVKEVKLYEAKVPIFHSDGTKLAVVKGSQLYDTDDGKKAGVSLRHLPGVTVCEISGKPVFEIQRKGAAAITMTAELYTYDATFLRWSDTFITGLLFSDPDKPLKIGGLVMSDCYLEGPVGIQIGQPSQSLGAAIFMQTLGGAADERG